MPLVSRRLNPQCAPSPRPGTPPLLLRLFSSYGSATGGSSPFELQIVSNVTPLLQPPFVAKTSPQDTSPAQHTSLPSTNHPQRPPSPPAKQIFPHSNTLMSTQFIVYVINTFARPTPASSAIAAPHTLPGSTPQASPIQNLSLSAPP
jgi:hypothetical protein